MECNVIRRTNKPSLGPHINDPSRNMMDAVEHGGPIDRIIVEKATDHPTEIMMYSIIGKKN